MSGADQQTSAGHKGRVLIVAGSDSGGGAGIQADIKAVTALGGYAMTAVTALTSQNTLGVHGIHPIPPAFIAEQMRVVLDDLGADCIKLGMLHSVEVIEAVAAVLETHAPAIPVVADPVMVAKGGASLLQDDAVAALTKHILPKATVLTPNVPEAEVLTGTRIEGPGDMEPAAKALRDLGAGAVLLKGGHMDGPEVSDLLAMEGGLHKFTHPRLDTPHTHGTGCTLASSVAAGLAQGLDLPSAVRRGTDYVAEAIRTAPGLGGGHGPLNHGHTFINYD